MKVLQLNGFKSLSLMGLQTTCLGIIFMENIFCVQLVTWKGPDVLNAQPDKLKQFVSFYINVHSVHMCEQV